MKQLLRVSFCLSHSQSISSTDCTTSSIMPSSERGREKNTPSIHRCTWNLARTYLEKQPLLLQYTGVFVVPRAHAQ